MYKFIMVALVALSPSIAFANGGGSSKGNTGTVKVTNNSGLVALVAIDPSDSLKAATTLAQFKSRGGVVLNPAESHDFKNVKAGAHQLVYARVAANATTVTANDFTTQNITVTKGKTLNVSVPAP